MKSSKQNISLIIGSIALLISFNIAITETHSSVKGETAVHASDYRKADVAKDDDHSNDFGPVAHNENTAPLRPRALRPQLSQFALPYCFCAVSIRDPPVSSFASLLTL